MPWTDIFAARGEDDIARRTEIVTTLATDAEHYADPHRGQVDGRDGLLQVIAGFRQAMTDGSPVAHNAERAITRLVGFASISTS